MFNHFLFNSFCFLCFVFVVIFVFRFFFVWEAMGGHSGIPAKIHFLMFSGREAMGGHSGIPAKIHFLMFSGREATGGHGNTEKRAHFDLNPFFPIRKNPKCSAVLGTTAPHSFPTQSHTSILQNSIPTTTEQSTTGNSMSRIPTQDSSHIQKRQNKQANNKTQTGPPPNKQNRGLCCLQDRAQKRGSEHIVNIL